MDFYAFLGPPMGKEKPDVKLRTVDEETGKGLRYVRLHKDSTEEVEELPPVRVGKLSLAPRLEREEMKTRSNEPDIGSLIERDEIMLEDEWEAESAERRVPWGWLALIGSVFAAGVLWSLIQVNRAEDRQKGIETGSRSLIDSELREEAAATDLIGNIEEVTKAFYGAGSIEELLEHVRQPDRVRTLMEDYYRERLQEPARVLRIDSMDPLTIENHANFWMVAAKLSPERPSPVLVEVDANGEAKVDWETFVTYQPMDWDEFAVGRPGAMTNDFRVYVEPDHFYSHEFADAEMYDCYRLTTLGSEETLFGYVRREVELAAVLKGLVEQNQGRATPLILKLHVPENVASRRGVLILEVVNPSWLFVESPEGGL